MDVVKGELTYLICGFLLVMMQMMQTMMMMMMMMMISCDSSNMPLEAW